MFQEPPSFIITIRSSKTVCIEAASKRSAHSGQPVPDRRPRRVGQGAERLALHLAPAITSAAQIDKMLNMPKR